jgi:hypothetical protein
MVSFDFLFGASGIVFPDIRDLSTMEGLLDVELHYFMFPHNEVCVQGVATLARGDNSLREDAAGQAAGCLKERIQSEHERNSCATAQGKEGGRKGCLM